MFLPNNSHSLKHPVAPWSCARMGVSCARMDVLSVCGCFRLPRRRCGQLTLRTMMATSLCRSLRLLFNVNACLDGADMFTRQASEALGRISHILDVKKDLDFEVGCRRRCSRRSRQPRRSLSTPDQLVWTHQWRKTHERA